MARQRTCAWIAACVLVSQGVARAEPVSSADGNQPAGVIARDGESVPQLRPFLRPGWSRAGLAEGFVRDEERTWPYPLIAPAEPFNLKRLAYGYAPQPIEVACFSPKSTPTAADIQAVETAMFGLTNLRPRYVVTVPWPTSTVTWSLAPDGTTISINGRGSAPSTLFATMDGQFGSRAQWIGLIESCLARWSQVTGIKFVRVRYNGQDWDDGVPWDPGMPGGAGAEGAPGLRGDIRIGARAIDGTDNILAVTLYPPNVGSVGTSIGGNMTFDAVEDWTDSTDDYRFFKNVFMHEIGHGLGLEHVCQSSNTRLMEPVLALAFAGPQHDDIRAVQRLYGDVKEPNNSAATATDQGAISASSSRVLGGMPASLFGPTPNSSVLAIGPSTDVDWHQFFLTVSTTVSVTLSPVGFTYADACIVGDPPTINTQATQRLRVSIIGANGTTVLGTGTAAIIGQNAVVSNISVPAGVFYVKVDSASTGDQTQMYVFSVATGTPARPVNDDCANAAPIFLRENQGSNGGALLDGSPTLCGVSVFSDVWYSYTPTCDGTLRIDTCGSALDTVIGVYLACGGAAVACNDNVGPGAPCTGGGDSFLTLPATRGATLLIRIAGRTSSQNSFFLELALDAPPNDRCADARPLGSGSISEDGSTCGATNSYDTDGYASCGTSVLAPDVWYTYLPDCNGQLELDTCNSQYDTVISLHSGTCGALTTLVCNDDTAVPCSPVYPRASRIVANVTAGTLYYIRVCGAVGATGRFGLNGEVGQANDLCTSAAAIAPGITTGTLCRARRETSSPCAAGSASPDVFYQYIPAISGVMTLDSCSSAFNTVLEVLTGTCAAPVSIACNNDQGSITCAAGPTTARIDLPVTAGTPYIIRVSGSGGAQGAFSLRLAQAPANDLCLNAPLITNGSVAGTTVDAGRESNPSSACSPAGAAPDVWYRWVAPCTGFMTVNTCGSVFDTVVSVLSGPNCSVLAQIACNDDTQVNCGTSGVTTTLAALEAPVVGGVTYFIRVSGKGNASGPFTLTVGNEAANDTCPTASTVTAGSTAFDNRCANSEGSALCFAPSASQDVWFQYVAACNGAVWMNTCASGFNTVLSVGTGSCTELTAVACNDDQGSGTCPSNALAARVVFRGTAGAAYLVRVGGVGTAAGTGTLNIVCCAADYNLSGSLTIDDLFLYFNGYFTGAPAADFNGVGGVTIDDLFLYLNAYFTGC